MRRVPMLNRTPGMLANIASNAITKGSVTYGASAPGAT
jgi:hypothetical protein